MNLIRNSLSPKLPSKNLSFFPTSISTHFTPQTFTSKSKTQHEPKPEPIRSVTSNSSHTISKKICLDNFKEDLLTNRLDCKEEGSHVSFPLEASFSKPRAGSKETLKFEKKKTIATVTIKGITRKTPIAVEKKTEDERGQLGIYDYLMKQKNKLGFENKASTEKKAVHTRSISITGLKKEEQSEKDARCGYQMKAENLESSRGQSRQHETSTATTNLSHRSLEMTQGEEENVLSCSNKSNQKDVEDYGEYCYGNSNIKQRASKKPGCAGQTSSINIDSLMYEERQKESRSRYGNQTGGVRESRSYEGRDCVENYSKKRKDIFGMSEETRKRKKELLGLHQKMAKKIEEMSQLGGSLQEQKRRLHEDVQDIEERIQNYTEDTVKALRKYTEAYVSSINQHFVRDFKRLDQLSRKLEEYSGTFFNMKEDIEVNFYKIIAITDQRLFKTIMEEYSQKLAGLSDLNEKVKESNVQAGIPVWEELAYFKKTLKGILEEPELKMSSQRYEDLISDSPKCIAKGKSKSKDHYENPLQLKKQTSVQKSENVRESHRQISNLDIKRERTLSPVLISFENKEIFENALQTATEAISTEKSTQDTHRKTFASTVFTRTESDEFSYTMLSDPRRTPRLKFELWEQPSGDINEFREDDDREQMKKAERESEVVFGPMRFSKALGVIDINRNEVVRDSISRRVKTEYDEDLGFLEYLESKNLGKGTDVYQNPFMRPPMSKGNGI